SAAGGPPQATRSTAMMSPLEARMPCEHSGARERAVSASVERAGEEAVLLRRALLPRQERRLQLRALPQQVEVVEPQAQRLREAPQELRGDHRVRLHQLVEAVALEREELALLDRAHGGRARAPAQERHLAEVVARLQRGDL